MSPPYFFDGKLIDHPFTFSTKIYEDDNVQQLEERIAEASITSSPDDRTLSDHPPPFERIIRRAIVAPAPKILRYFLERGAETHEIESSAILAILDHDRVLEVLDILLSFGWDIEDDSDLCYGSLGQFVLARENVLKWCVDHGLDVSKTPDDRDLGLIEYEVGLLLLERCVYEGGTIASFDLLRSLDVPFGGRELHLACARVCGSLPPNRESPDTDDENIDALDIEAKSGMEERYRQRMGMVRHLVEVVGLDVNATHQRWRDDERTPLGYVMSEDTGDKSTFELVAFLLDRGADPEHPVTDSVSSWPSIMEAARSRNKTGFLRAVAAWKDKVALEKGETLA